MRRIPILFLISAMLISSCGLFNPTDPGSNGTPTLPDPVQTTESAPDPDSAAQQFLDTWNEGDYAGMYALFSPLTRDGLSEDDFIGRLEEIIRTGAFVDVDFQIVSALVNSPQRAEVRYRIVLTSASVGEITRETRMDLTRSAGEDWRVAWTDAMILPELEGGNGLSLTTITPTRANIYDRNNQAFAAEAAAGQDNAAALWIVPNEIGDDEAEETMLSTLRRLFELVSTDSILARYESFRDTDYFTPLGVAPFDDYNAVGGLLASVGGVRARTYSTRYYYGSGLTPFAGGISPHTVGFVSQVQADEYDDLRAQGYQGDEFVGRIGIEAAFEDELRGVPGGTLYLVDPNDQILQAVAARDPGLPYAVYTTLDRDLQEIAQRSIEGFQGAVVVLERDTGAVLAMASSPAFDPNLFDFQNPNGSNPNGGFQMLNSANQPYINRATQGLYAPGSVFKIVTMAAALETEYYEPDDVYDCGLTFTELPGWVGYDWRYEKELPAAGELTLKEGLEKSCNPWFYHIGLDLYVKSLPSAIPDMATAFGLGQTTGVEIGDEAGQVPSPENSAEVLGEEWAAWHPVQLAIGQSVLLVSPLQVARYVAAVGNGGTLYRPQLVLEILNAEGDMLQEFVPDPQAQLPVSPENLAAIQEAMVNVVDKPGATAYRKFLGINLNVAGKTGTASTEGDPHAWFAGYTFEEREDKPDIAIAVILENVGEGSDWAAPVFRRIVETYFKGRPLTLYPWESRIWVERIPDPDEEAEEAPTP
ncbi:MAG: hypothetical protein KAR65_01560 [Anaerolineales bacterium]|nr:hypothetical protein [Anaerolineales bacterium]